MHIYFAYLCEKKVIIKDLENRLMKSESICKKQENDIQGLKFKLSQMNDRKERVYDEENAKDVS